MFNSAPLWIGLFVLAASGCAPAPAAGDQTDGEDHASLDDSFDDGGKADSGGLLRAGLHPDADAALRTIRTPVEITSARISQTIGNFAASAGTHAVDGHANGRPYSAATDLRIGDLEEAQVAALLEQLGRAGFAAWYRDPGHDHWPSDQARHVHAVYAGCAMKALLVQQVDDYLAGDNGLVGHAHYEFFQPSAEAAAAVRALFDAHR